MLEDARHEWNDNRYDVLRGLPGTSIQVNDRVNQTRVD